MPRTFALVMMLVAVASAAGCGRDPQSLSVNWHSEGRQVEVTLSLEHVGVVLHDGARREELAALLPPGLRLSEARFPEFELLEPAGDGALDRDELMRQARELARSAGGLIRHAGLLARHAGSDQPHLVTHEVLVRLQPDLDAAARATLLQALDVELVRSSRFDPHLLLVAPRDALHVDAIELANRLHGQRGVVFAEPNAVRDAVRTAAHAPVAPAAGDPLLGQQWHLDNTGQSLGTPDADIDAPEAWGLSRGSPEVTIAVLENGFDAAHPDLVQNLWSDPADPDLHGWDFQDGDGTLQGDPHDPDATAHGTCVIGCAAARGDNDLGGSGSCPECSLMLLRISDPTNPLDDADAFRYAWQHGAAIITNSWTYAFGDPVPQAVREAIAEAATAGRGGRGCVILFAVRNENLQLDGSDDIATMPEVIAVGSVANTDEHTSVCGWGQCVSVLGPSRLNKAPNFTEGTLDVTTTDWRASQGYNHDPALATQLDAGWTQPDELLHDDDYTARFGGTSAATPTVAGVVGLLLAADPELTAAQVRRVLQDTADRVQDSQAHYSPVNGKCPGGTHGHGRVNAFEAVRLVAPPAAAGGASDPDGGGRGRGGVDLFVRDNALDWGNTIESSTTRFEAVRGVMGCWSSPDVKLDAPPFSAAPASSADFESFEDEAPQVGVANRVYVRIRNRGVRAAREVSVRLAWTAGATSLPAWAWPEGPGDEVSDWQWRDADAVLVASVPPSGASLAGTPGDAAAVAHFEFSPSGAPGGALALLVALDSPDDRFDEPGVAHSDLPGLRVPIDNDLALRGLRLAGGSPAAASTAAPAAASAAASGFVLRNPSGTALTCRLEFLAPPGQIASVPAAGTPTPIPGDTSFDGMVTIAQSDTTGRSLSSEFTLPPHSSAALAVALAPAPAGTPAPPPAPAAAYYSVPPPPDAAPAGFVQVRQWRSAGAPLELLGGLDLPLPTDPGGSPPAH